MNEKRWEVVRQFYMESFGIVPELVDLMASNEILLMCVSGSSNSSMSKILNIDEDSISEIILTIFDFSGWKEDLDINPLHVYEQDNSYISFVGAIAETRIGKETTITISDIDLMFRICEIYKSIEEKLEIGWV